MTLKDKLYQTTLGGLALATALTAQPAQKPENLSDLLRMPTAYAQENAHAGIDYDSISNQAEKVLTKKTYQQALEILQPFENAPDNKSYDFFNNLGVAYSYSGDYSKAEFYLKKSIELAQNREIPRINLGYLFLRLVKTPESKKLAEEQFRFILTNIDPNNKIAKMYLEGIKSGKY